MKTAASMDSILPCQSKNGRSDETWNDAFLVLRELMGGAFSDSGWSALRGDAAGSQCWADVMRCDSGDIGPLHPPLRSNASLAEAGDVGFPTRGSHYALSVAARDVVIYLGTCRKQKKEKKGNVKLRLRRKGATVVARQRAAPAHLTD